MKKLILTLFTLISISNSVVAENTESSANSLFHIGQMNSYDKHFALFFKTRDKAVLARGEDYNYVNKELGASITGSVLYLYTVYGAIYGTFFFNEYLESFHYLGTILVFVGIFLIKKKI